MFYVLFAYDTYYPSGGMGDLVGRYQTLEEAKAAFEGQSATYGDVVLVGDQTFMAVWSGEWRNEAVIWTEVVQP